MNAKRLGRGARKGQALVEFALVLPLFILLVCAMIDFGWMLLLTHNLTNAARVGCRVGTLPGSQTADVQQAVTNFFNRIGFSGLTFTVTVEVRDANGVLRPTGLAASQYGDQVFVGVSSPMPVLTGLIMRYMGGSPTARGRCAFRHE